jgi:hypothetical protein
VSLPTKSTILSCRAFAFEHRWRERIVRTFPWHTGYTPLAGIDRICIAKEQSHSLIQSLWTSSEDKATLTSFRRAGGIQSTPITTSLPLKSTTLVSGTNNAQSRWIRCGLMASDGAGDEGGRETGNSSPPTDPHNMQACGFRQTSTQYMQTRQMRQVGGKKPLKITSRAGRPFGSEIWPFRGGRTLESFLGHLFAACASSLKVVRGFALFLLTAFFVMAAGSVVELGSAGTLCSKSSSTVSVLFPSNMAETSIFTLSFIHSQLLAYTFDIRRADPYQFIR